MLCAEVAPTERKTVITVIKTFSERREEKISRQRKEERKKKTRSWGGDFCGKKGVKAENLGGTIHAGTSASEERIRKHVSA